MIPVIALVGRPNVGKSTLFNRITRSRNALVANYSGLTRDRQYGEAIFENKRCIVVDTGGIYGNEIGVDEVMAEQSRLAIDEADEVIFMVDCKEGVTAVDEAIARVLRSRNKPVYLVANKVDGMEPDLAIADFHRLGFGRLMAISASQGRSVNSLLQDILAPYPEETEEAHSGRDKNESVKIAVVGRPNVGKSTLVNRILGEERVIVFDMPGTTRDSIYIDFERGDRHYTLIDTAGIRRRKNIKLTVEKFSIVKTLQAIDDANVVILLMDAHEGIVEQDLHLLGHVIEAGRALVVAVNKWDGLEPSQKEHIKRELDRRLGFVNFAEIHFISALHGTGVGHLYKSIDKAYGAAKGKLQTSELTRILQVAVETHQPPMVNGRRIKLRYAHAGGSNPPRIIIHGNQVDKLPDHYTRFLEKTFRSALKLSGTPVKIEYRVSENPFQGRKKKKPASEKTLPKKRPQNACHRKK
ncbi:MAG: ribosome biogenesis GTPase Der [Pseudomonadales bacterium]|nr:ribosome biogenesis GTPase Der [Pseudomonadales bacterium]